MCEQVWTKGLKWGLAEEAEGGQDDVSVEILPQPYLTSPDRLKHQQTAKRLLSESIICLTLLNVALPLTIGEAAVTTLPVCLDVSLLSFPLLVPSCWDGCTLWKDMDTGRRRETEAT